MNKEQTGHKSVSGTVGQLSVGDGFGQRTTFWSHMQQKGCNDNQRVLTQVRFSGGDLARPSDS
jgi:hypothetical protein